MMPIARNIFTAIFFADPGSKDAFAVSTASPRLHSPKPDEMGTDAFLKLPRRQILSSRGRSMACHPRHPQRMRHQTLRAIRVAAKPAARKGCGPIGPGTLAWFDRVGFIDCRRAKRRRHCTRGGFRYGSEWCFSPAVSKSESSHK